ncbi:LysR family transcriptional regulator [soil metagenome]
MLLGQVEGFLEVVRHGNVSRAATALSITQPALTARLQGLEREVGQKLFVRARKGIQLTEAGRAFLPYAERAVASLRGGMELVSEMRSGGTGELVLAAAPAVSTYVLPTLLVRFAAQHPSVRLVVRTGHSEEVVEMVARGEVQLGIVRALRHPMVTTRPLYEDEVILVTDPRHPFAATGRVTLDQLTEARLILFDRASSYYDLTNAIFREAGVLPRAVMELDNIEAAKKMVELGLGVAVLPQTAIADELRQGVLRAVEIEGSPRIRRRIVMVRHRDAGPPQGVVATFIEGLREVPDLVPGARRPEQD